MQITNGRDSTRTVAYTYDQVNRLATAQTPTAPTWGDSYVYDAWGNLLQKNVTKGTAETMTLTMNANNQVTTPAFTYDAAGHVTSDTSVVMTYDAEGRMNPTSGTTYTYDGDGRRVKKSDGTVYWVDDQLRPVSVGTTSGSITRDYVFLGKKRIAHVTIASGNAYYYLGDHLGSTAVVASGDGKTVQWEADFFPFGALRQVFTNTASNNYDFTGYEYDSDTKYNYALSRFEAGRWGRFLSPDPFFGSIDLTRPQSLNRYSYSLNNPTNMIDPFGLDETDTDGGVCDEWDVVCQDGGESAGNGGYGWDNTTSCGIGCIAVVSSAPMPPDDDDDGITIDVDGSDDDGWDLLPISTSTNTTICPPVPFKVTGIAPHQAPGKTAISQQPRSQIKNGGVAIKPQNFGAKGINGDNRPVFLGIKLYADWGGTTIPKGIPTAGPFRPVDNIGPKSVRLSPGNMIDVYNYKSTAQANASTRVVNITAVIPNNNVGVTCPK